MEDCSNLIELSKNKNLILYLPSRKKKDFISTLIIKQFCKEKNIFCPIDKGGTRIFLIVNTMALVSQQACQIVSQTTLAVGKYTGDIGVDLWDDDVWKHELNKYQILVMTCQIALNLLKTNRVSLTNINLIIFDDCYKAVSNHPMRQIMKEFEKVPTKQQPRVLGLTATILNGNCKLENITKEVTELKKTFMAEIQYNFDEELHTNKPIENKVSYDKNVSSHPLYQFFNSNLSSSKNRSKEVKIGSKAAKKIKYMFNDIEFNMNDLGVSGGCLALRANLLEFQIELTKQHVSVVRILNELHSLRETVEREIENSDLSDLEKLKMFSSDKVIKLFAVLKCLKSSESAIVFVDRKSTAKMLYYLVSEAATVDPKLAYIKCDFVVGYNLSDLSKANRENYLKRKQNAKVIDMFNKGNLNVLFASKAVEDGVDIVKCDYVIMFDSDLDFPVYEQSKYRARNKDSKFVIMICKSEKSFAEKYASFLETERFLKNVLFPRKSNLKTTTTLKKVEENQLTSISELDPCKPSEKNGQERTEPTIVPMETYNFTPNLEENEVFEDVVDSRTVKVGTSSYKRTCEKKWADTLSGCAPQPNQEVYLHLIYMAPKDRPPVDRSLLAMHLFLRPPTNFGIVSSKKLPNLEPFSLYLEDKELIVKISSGMKIKLNEEELQEISEFHCTIFDSVLKLAKPFMVRDLTNTQNGYFIVPTVKPVGEGLMEGFMIFWDAIRESKKTFPLSSDKLSMENRQSLEVKFENYYGMIVAPMYPTLTDKKYIVSFVYSNISKETQELKELYENYKEYFKDKYKIEPSLKNQSLIKVLPVYSNLNSTKPRAPTKQIEDDSEGFKGYLFPELCLIYPLRGRYWLKALLLPSVLHRISQLCLAEELRCKIASKTGISVNNYSPERFQLKEEVGLKTRQDSCQNTFQYLELPTLSNETTFCDEPDFCSDEEEPVDIERCMKSVTSSNILCYKQFIKKPLTMRLADREHFALSETPGSMKHYDKIIVNPPPLPVLSEKDNTGPQQIEVLEALTAAEANDLFNCERSKCLGNSFLKLAVSLTLFDAQNDLEGGELSKIREEVVGTKNLYFCGKKKGLAPFLGLDEFSPDKDWVPPGFHVPHSVQEAIRSGNLNVDCLYNVEIPDAERKCGGMTIAIQDLYNCALLDNSNNAQNCKVLHPQNCSLINQLAFTDKNVADAIESILGVYLKSSGMLGALDVMNWFGVTDPGLSTHQVLSRITKSAAMGSGDPKTHLHQPRTLELILNYKFQDSTYLLQALTHPTYTCNNITKCYHCLEFLGDAVIDFLITVHIFEKFCTMTPAELTDLRSALLNNVTLACISVRNDFHKFLLHHSFLLYECIASFVKDQEEKNHEINHDTLFFIEEEVNTTEEFYVPKALSDVFKALIGAVYLDSGKDLNVTWKIVYNLMREEIEGFSKEVPENHVKMLCESGFSPKFNSHFEESSGSVMVTVDIQHNDSLKQFKGYGSNECQATRAAATRALCYIQSLSQL